MTATTTMLRRTSADLAVPAAGSYLPCVSKRGHQDNFIYGGVIV